jgi:phosphomannomutase/phosphomannomutase/phosphoglucomutase
MTAQSETLPAFKAYDIRGRIPDQLHPAMVYCIGRAYARVIRPEGVVAIGHDIRLTSESFAQALIAGLNAEGVATCDIGLCGTEMIYYAAAQPGMGGGIMITASHNPKDYNGLKMVKAEARPISADNGLKDIEKITRELLAEGAIPATFTPQAGMHGSKDILAGYVEKVLSFIKPEAIKPLHVVINAGNGCAGVIFDAVAEKLPLKVTRIQHEADGNFPNGVPNPMLEECQRVTAQAVIEHGADLGIAWDGDFDRCFFFDEKGTFIEGYYLVGMLAEQLLRHSPGAAIVHDPRLVWNTVESVEAAGGKAVISKCGHSFIKEKMREVDGVYGGEMSAHHYFRNFFYCDSGMIPWLLLVELLSEAGKPFSAVVNDCMQAYPCSGEINFTVADAKGALLRIRETYANDARLVETLDGLSMDFGSWRFNVRSSNTEPVVRLNVESRADTALMRQQTDALAKLLTA